MSVTCQAENKNEIKLLKKKMKNITLIISITQVEQFQRILTLYTTLF